MTAFSRRLLTEIEQKKGYSDYGKKWTQEEVARFPKDKEVTAEILKEVQALFPLRKPSSIWPKLKAEGYIWVPTEVPAEDNTVLERPEPIVKAEEAVLEEELPETIEGKLDEIILLLRQLVGGKKNHQTYARWDSEQEYFLLELFHEGLDLSTISKSIKEEFNIDRTTGAITARLRKLGAIE